MHPVRRLTRFGAVGALATLCHFSVALAVHRMLDHAGSASPALLANFAGFSTAAVVSYFGHARLTFGITSDHARHFPRFLVVALAGLALSGLVTHLICEIAGGPFLLAMIVAVTAIPAISFLLMRFWAFTSRSNPPGP